MTETNPVFRLLLLHILTYDDCYFILHQTGAK